MFIFNSVCTELAVEWIITETANSVSNQPQQGPLTSSSFLFHALIEREFCLLILQSSSRTLVFLGQFQDSFKKNTLIVRKYVNVRFNPLGQIFVCFFYARQPTLPSIPRENLANVLEIYFAQPTPRLRTSTVVFVVIDNIILWSKM